MSTNVVNPAAPELVVQNYFNLVGAIASRVKGRVPSHVDVQDLVQNGMIGLLEASERSNPAPAVEFSIYANSRITALAVFRPIPTPGILSTGSPEMARTSPISFGGTSHFVVTCSSPSRAKASFGVVSSAFAVV